MHSRRLSLSPEHLPDRSSLKDLWFLGQYLRPHKVQAIIAGVALLITSSSVLGMGWGIRYLVDQGLNQGNAALLDRAFLILFGITLLLAGATWLRYYMVTTVGEKVIAAIRRDVFRHVIRLDIPFFETNRTGELLSRISTDTTLLQTVVDSSVSVALRNTLMLVGGTTMLLITSPKLTAYVFLVVPLVVVPIIYLGRRVRLLSRATQDRIADMGAQAEEMLYGIRTIQAFSHEERSLGHFIYNVDTVLATSVKRIRLRAWLTAIVITLIFGAIAFVLWIGGRDLLAGNITAGELSSFVFYAFVVAGSVGAISEVVGELQRAAGSAGRLVELLKSRPHIASPPNPHPLPRPVHGAVSFRDVQFAYPSRPDKPALADFSLDVRPGSTVALVGASGAGKSTVLQLLQRFYDPQSGSILLDGMDIKQLRLEELRAQFAIVPQEPVIFSGTALENIRYGNPEASEEEVRHAAETAAALEFIEKLPDGFATYLGEKGVRLSGGQRQRIAIARAVLKNPKVLLLDEATSALDSENERLVQKALEQVMQGRTSIAIAHRLATIRRADAIVVMEQGRIEAIGSHEELLRSSPIYRHYAGQQFVDAA